MGIIVDVIILAILAISIFIGYKRGLIKCAVNVLSFFIAIIVVILLTGPVSNLIINNTKLDDNIKSAVLEKFNFKDIDEDTIELNKENSAMPEVVREYINGVISTSTGDIAEVVAENVAIMIINIGVAIILFIGTKLVLVFVKVLADIVGKIPLIKQFNNTGGIIYGIASGIVKVYLVLAIISMIVPLLTNTSLIEAINSSVIGGMMYNNNLLLKIVL